MSEKSTKTYDPLLREAMKEITAVMKKYDVAGYVALGSLTHFEFRLQPEASWSMMKIESRPDGGHGLRIQIKGKLNQARQAMADATTAFIYNLRDNFAIQFNTMQEFTKRLEEQANITHKPGDPSQNEDREIEDQA